MTIKTMTTIPARLGARRCASTLTGTLRGCVVGRKHDALLPISDSACISRLSSSSSRGVSAGSSSLITSSSFPGPAGGRADLARTGRFVSSVGGSNASDDEDEHYDDFADEEGVDQYYDGEEYAANDNDKDDGDAHSHLGLPQSDVHRIDLAGDPVLAKLGPVDTVRRILSDIPLGGLHPSDVLHGLTPLLKDCCLLQTEVGMRTAHSLLERLLKEKKNVNALNLQTVRDQAAEHGRHGRLSTAAAEVEVVPPLVVPSLPFHILAHGWSRMSGRGYHRDGPTKILDLIDWMAREDQYDAHITGF